MRQMMIRGLAAAALALAPAVARAAGHSAGPSGTIAYTGSDGNLYLIGADGSGKRALTSDGDKAPYTQPVWAPNGSALLSLRFATSLQALRSSSLRGLWLIQTNGQARQLTPDVPRSVAWAPDSRSVIYVQGFPPAATTLVQVDLRTGRKHIVPCDSGFSLKGITPLGNRAIGVQRGQIEAISLAKGTAQALTHDSKSHVEQDLAVLARSGRTVLYNEMPGGHLMSLDLRSGRSTQIRVIDGLRGIAPSPDLRWIAYSVTGANGQVQSALWHVGKETTPLGDGTYIMPQAFARDASALVYTVQGTGSTTITVASTGCAATCTRSLGPGQDAVWQP